MDNKTLPYNCPLVPEWFEEFRDIKECFTYMGGLPYEILKHSGLDTLEIFGFFEDRNWEDIDSLKKLRSGTRILALEVYMDLENGAEPRKAYLYSDITEEYYAVFEAGEVVEGKLILKKEKLANLAGQGYCCIVPTNGKETEIYRSEYAQIFGLDFMAFEIQPWSDKRRVSSNGYKEVYLVLSHSVYLDAGGGALATLTEPKNLGDLVFEVDNYALDTCRRLLEQERYIRGKINPTFFVNQINPYDSEVLQYLRTASEGVFLKEVGYALEDFPECYQRLAYDTAYIRYYFPDIQQRMKLSHSQAECVAVGISMDMSRYARHCLYAANYMSDGSIHLIKNPKLSEKISDLRACCELENIHEFPISYDLCNAGVAASELGMVMREILDKNCYQDVANVGISLFKRVPDKEEIQQYMEHQKEFQKNHTLL